MRLDSIAGKRLLYLCTVLIAVFGVLFFIFISRGEGAVPFLSSELSIAEFSPRGPMGGAVMPASGASGAGCSCGSTSYGCSIGNGRNQYWGTCYSCNACPPPPPPVGACNTSAERAYAYNETVPSGSGCSQGSRVNFSGDPTPGGSATWQCQSSSGTSRVCSATKNDYPPPPTVTLTANPAQVAYDGSSRLSWTIGGVAESCTASGDWSGAKNKTGGFEDQSALKSDKNYTITCTPANPANPLVSDSATVDVLPLDGSCGGAAQVYEYNEGSWQGSFCAVGDVSPASPAFPPVPPFPVAQNSSSWVCQGKNGGINRNCTAYRNAPPECMDGGDNDGDGLSDADDLGCNEGGGYDPNDNDETLSCVDGGIDTDLSIIRRGDSAVLTFTNSSDAATCTLTGGGYDNDYVSGGVCVTNTLEVNPTFTTTYTLSCTDDGGTTEESVTVRILPAVDEN